MTITGFKTTLQSAAAATGNGTAMDVEGLAVVGIQVTGTFSGTVTFEGTTDGTNYVAVRTYNHADGAKATTVTAPALLQIPVAGLKNLRARVSAYSSGAITVVGLGVTNSPGMALVA